MALQEGYSIVHPPLFNSNNFTYLKGMMKFYLMNDNENQFTIKKGFTIPQDKLGQPLEVDK